VLFVAVNWYLLSLYAYTGEASGRRTAATAAKAELAVNRCDDSYTFDRYNAALHVLCLPQMTRKQYCALKYVIACVHTLVVQHFTARVLL
jgi:hypothetical protein